MCLSGSAEGGREKGGEGDKENVAMDGGERRWHEAGTSGGRVLMRSGGMKQDRRSMKDFPLLISSPIKGNPRQVINLKVSPTPSRSN